VVDLPTAHGQRPELEPASAAVEVTELQCVSAVDRGGPGVERLHGRAEPLSRAGWPEHGQRPGAPSELAVDDEKRQPTEVVAVQMADHNGIHLARFDVLGLHRGQAGGSAVDQRGVSVAV
jgi:hypothetical protein